MATVKEMIEWLNTLPQDAEVLCGEEDFCGYDLRMVHSPVDLDSCKVNDFTSEEDRKKFPDMAGRIVVVISA